MRKRISLVLVAVLLLTAAPLATEKTAQAIDYSTVRVLISSNNATVFTGLSIAVKGNYFVQENGARFSGGTLTVSTSGGKVVLSHSSAGQLYAGSSVNVMRESFAPSAGTLSMSISGKTRSFLGNFLFKAVSNGIRVVNTVPIQHYLYGVVAFEMSDLFPIEALKAQAIAAKCYVLSGMAPTADYDIGDTANDQVYKGYNASYSAVMRAVDETFDVWLYLGNSILCSYFAASNGGQTALPSDIWAGTNRYIWDKAYDRRADPYDLANPLTVQETTFYPTNGDAGRISGALSNYLRNRSTDILRKQYNDPGLVVTYIEAIHSIQQRTERTADINLSVTARFSNGGSQSVNYAYTEDFAYLTTNGVFTKPQTLRLYVVTPVNGGWELLRGRYGHGVGLSQRGAEQMANQGMRYEQILNFYYPGATLRSMGLSMPTDPANINTPAQGGNALGNPIATAKTTGTVNLRAGASTNTTKLDTVPANVDLVIYAQQDGFSLTQYNNQTGYVSNSYLKITPLTTEQPQTQQAGNAITSFGEVTSSTLNFRDRPVNGKVLQTLKKGAKLDIYGYSDNTRTWYYCAANGKTGYVSVQYVKITGYPTAATETPQTQQGGSTGVVSSGATGTINTEGVYMRTKPTTSSGTRIAALQKGLQVTVLGEEGDFYQVTVSSYTGYVQKQYVNVAAAGNTGSTGNTGNTNTVQKGKTTGLVNFRTGPGTNYSKIKQLKKGVNVEILSLNNGWYEVKVDGVSGYLSSDYVAVTGDASSGSASSTGTNGVTTGNVNMRSSASTLNSKNIITKLNKGTKLTILETKSGWCRVSVNGQEGYVSATYVKAS